MRYIQIDLETERLLSTICDAALKNGGMYVLGMVNQLFSSIKADEVKIE